LFISDRSNAPRKTIRQVLGDDAPVQRCFQHNRATCSTISPSVTATRLRPGSARGGTRRTTTGRSNSLCESTIATVGQLQRYAKNWSSGQMCLRWTSAGMLETEGRFRRVEGYRGLANLAVLIEAISTAVVTTPPRGHHHRHCVTTTSGPPSLEPRGHPARGIATSILRQALLLQVANPSHFEVRVCGEDPREVRATNIQERRSPPRRKPTSRPLRVARTFDVRAGHLQIAGPFSDTR
jgi:hypothetical protein